MARQSHRQKLIDSGLTTVHQRGFAASGVREITAASGVPQGSFTNHFRSKEDFGLAVLDRYFERTEAIIASTLRDESRPPGERLLAYFEAVSGFLEGVGWRHGCLISNMSLEAAEHSELLRERLVAIFGSLNRSFADAVRAAQNAGVVRNDLAAEDLADVVLAAWNGAMLRMKVDRSPEPLRRFQRVLVTTLLAAPTAAPPSDPSPG